MGGAAYGVVVCGFFFRSIAFFSSPYDPSYMVARVFV